MSWVLDLTLLQFIILFTILLFVYTIICEVYKRLTGPCWKEAEELPGWVINADSRHIHMIPNESRTYRGQTFFYKIKLDHGGKELIYRKKRYHAWKKDGIIDHLMKR